MVRRNDWLRAHLAGYGKGYVNVAARQKKQVALDLNRHNTALNRESR